MVDDLFGIELLAQIGQGGQGVVFKGLLHSLPVAIKVRLRRGWAGGRAALREGGGQAGTGLTERLPGDALRICIHIRICICMLPARSCTLHSPPAGARWQVPACMALRFPACVLMRMVGCHFIMHVCVLAWHGMAGGA